MPHHHGRSYLVRRQQNDPEAESDDQQQDVETVVSVRIVTMPNTFTGEVVWITQDPSEATTTGNSNGPNLTSKAAAVSKMPSISHRSESKATSKPSPSHNEPSAIMLATSPPTVAGTPGIVGVVSTSASMAASATAQASRSGGVSGGAKAGLVLGILLAVGALLAGVLFLYSRKKKQIAQKQTDDEKTAIHNVNPPVSPQVEAAPITRSQHTMSTAPRLSLRPVTQFSPGFGDNRKSGANLLDVVQEAALAARSGERTPSPDRPSSNWERPGATNATAASRNPFNDPQPGSSSPPQNPFGNDAAIDISQASGPGTPVTINHSANHSAVTNTDFGNPVPAIAAAQAAPMSPVASPPALEEFPVPGSTRPNSDAVPPSLAWTDDIPASPGPAPTGPPPIAVPGGRTNNSTPAADIVHRVQLDFNPSMQDELELRSGQLVRMLHEYDDGWALCVRMDRSQQGVVPRTCLSKHPVKPRTGPPRHGPPGPRMRGPPINSRMGSGGVPQPRPLTPSSGRNSPRPPIASPADGRMPSQPSSMIPAPRQMAPRHMSSPNMGPPGGRARSHSNAQSARPPRSMSPGPYGGGFQDMSPPPRMGRPRSNSAGQVMAKRFSPPGPSPMNPTPSMPMLSRKPLPGQAI